MFNPKIVAIASAVGFTLAFMVGLISGVRFGYILLRSCISAIICGGGAVAVKFVCKKYLLEGISIENTVSEPSGNSSSTVDVLVTEDDLPDDALAPSFAVKGYGRRSAEDSGFKSASVAEVTSPLVNEHLDEGNIEEIPQTAVSLEPNDFDDASAPVGETEGPVKAPEPIETPEPVVAPEPVMASAPSPAKSSNSVSVSSKSSDFDDLPSFRDISENETTDEMYNVNAPEIEGQNASSLAMAIRTMLEKDK